MITMDTHGDARVTATSATSAPVISSLSAVVSRNDPRRELTFQRRARRPSNQSVLAATRKTTAAAVQEWLRTRPMTTGVATIRTLVPTRINALARELPLIGDLSAPAS